MLGVSLRARRHKTQVMLGVSLRARCDTTLASTASTSPCVARENTSRCNHVKTCILGMMPGGERKGHPRMQYIDNIKKWTRASLEEK